MIKVWSDFFGRYVQVDTNNLYNGKTIEAIESNLEGWHEVDKKRYMQNVKDCIQIQLSGVNLSYTECLKYSNFLISKQYIETL